MKRQVTSLAAALIVAASLGACRDDPRAASESNFEDAIQRYLDTQPLCIEVPLSELPGEAPRGRLHQPQLDALVEAGLLQAQETSIVRDGRGQVPGARYAVTKKGQKFLSDTRSEYSGRPQLCSGSPTVTRIVRFSEPSAQGPAESSQVVYGYEYRQIPGWASEPRMTQQFNKLRYASPEEREGSMQLVLTDSGWVSSLQSPK
ncbi:MAG: hypothetical protein H0W24_04450 [Lysobacter sp.]|jgi:hypothetical protein|nr:hypothetical protein [Lysobacter sp.]